MLEKAEELTGLFKNKAEQAKKSADIEKLRVEFLGKKGHLSSLMQELRNVPNDQKKEAGQKINDAKQFIENAIAKRLAEIKEFEEKMIVEQAEAYDESMPVTTDFGSYHPITLVKNECENIFRSMGFTVEDYSEITDDYNCFEALNIPKHHPHW